MISNCVRYLFLGVIVSVLFDSGNCIKCYNCLSTTNEECLNPSEHENLKPQECVPELIKNLSNEVNKYAQSVGAALGIDIDKQTKNLNEILVCQKIESTVEGKKMLIRGCQIKDSALTDIDYCKSIEKQTKGTITHCSLCQEDGCNSAHWMAPVSLLSLLVPTLFLSIAPMLF